VAASQVVATGALEDLFQRLSDTHFNLILFGQQPLPEGAMDFGELLRIHVIPRDPVNDEELARVQIPQPSFYLIRPDGYVGLCGTRLEAGGVRSYVSQKLHLSI